MPASADVKPAVFWALAVLLLALAVHGTVAWQHRSDPLAATYVADADSYDRWADRIADQGLSAEPVFHQSPLYPLLLSRVYRIAAETQRPALTAAVQILLSSLALALLVPLGRLYVGSTPAGVVAALLALGYAPIVFYSLKLFPVSLALATQGAALIALAIARRSGAPWAAALAGATLGAACLARAEMLLFVPVAIAAVVRPSERIPDDTVLRRYGRTAALVIAAGLVVAPVTLHNLRRGDRVLIASSSGENLFIGNQVTGDGGYTALHPRAADIFSQRELARLTAEEASGRSLKPSEVSAYWRDRALKEVLENPGAWLALESRKLRLLLHPGDASDVYSFALERSHYLPALYFLPATAWCLILLGAVGGFVAFRQQRSRVWPLAAMVAVHGIVLMVFFVDTRLRIPWLYFLTPFGGLAIVWAIRSWVVGRDRVLISALALLATLSLIAGGILTRYGPRDVVRLASVLSLQGRLDDSLRVLEPAVKGPDADPYALDQAGWVLQKLGDFEASILRYRQALAAGLGRARERQTRTRLAMALEQVGRHDEAAAEHDAAVANETANAGTYFERGMFRLRRGERSAAEQDLNEAIRLDAAWPGPRAVLRRLGETPG
jgi:tetratricopeptide (TPR) repeat protein